MMRLGTPHTARWPRNAVPELGSAGVVEAVLRACKIHCLHFG